MAQVRQALERMGLSNQAAQFAVGANGLGLNTLQRWRDFQTDEHLTSLIKSFKAPGGTIGHGANAQRHPGFMVSMIAIDNIKIMRLALKYNHYVQRTVAPAEITQDWVEDWEFLVGHHETVAKSKIVEADLPKIKMTDWARTKERIMDFFSLAFGEEGLPLAYIIREDDQVPNEDADPRANYEGDHIRELIRRAPHQGKAFDANNRKMCALIKKMCQDTPAYEYVSSYTANGRAAWLVLVQNYLGPQHAQNTATIYERKIANATYEGETSRFGYDSYVNIQRQAYVRLDALKRHGYAGMDQGTLIRHHLNGIKTDKLKAVVELVRGNSAFPTFDEVTRRIKDSVVTMKPTTTTKRSISAISVKNRRGEEIFPGVEPDTSMQDKFYKPPEWAKLSKAQKKGVLLARQKRGPRPKNDETKKLSKENKKIKKQIAALSRKIGAVNLGSNDNEEDDDDDGSSDDEAVEPPTKKSKKSNSNRDHPNLSGRGGRGGRS